MLGAVGDLVDDIVVRFDRPGGQEPVSDVGLGAGGFLNIGTDTPARIRHRQGGSAANVCVAAVASGSEARFMGQVGDDTAGRMLEAALQRSGVEPVVRRWGRTATVIVLCHADGERTMITDRADADGLDSPELAWLDGLHYLHVPLYSLATGALAITVEKLTGWAREMGLPVSLDLSATVLCRSMGALRLASLLDRIQPGVVLANEAEAAVVADLGLTERMASPLLVVKRGAESALIRSGARAPVEVAAVDLGPVPDSTGAGDAFAGGWLAAAIRGADPVEATRFAHERAAVRLMSQGDGRR